MKLPLAVVCGLALTALALLPSCATNPRATTQPVTVKDLATTRPAYWLDQPPVATVESFQFLALWNACEDVARSYLFQLDRQDYRLGLLTTKPMISKQILEPWRSDGGTLQGVLESSLATIRRSIRFEIQRRDDGTFEMVPKVLVERETILERRITSSNQYRNAFSGPAAGSRTAADVEADVPVLYWTPIGRDPEMEKHLATAVRRRLGQSP
jgi:hypothetical protein